MYVVLGDMKLKVKHLIWYATNFCNNLAVVKKKRRREEVPKPATHTQFIAQFYCVQFFEVIISSTTFSLVLFSKLKC